MDAITSSFPKEWNISGIVNCRFGKIILAIAIIGGTCRAISKARIHQKKKKRIARSLQKKDVVILHQFPRGYNAPNVSPFPLKLETYLRMSNIPYESDFEDYMGPKQKCPYITLNGEDIADSQLIIEHLNLKYSINLNAGLSASDEALAHALRILAENSLYWSSVMFRWVYDKDHTITKVSSFSYPVFLVVKYLIWKQGWSHGIARHRKKEVMAMAHKDLDALSKLLETQRLRQNNWACILHRWVYDKGETILQIWPLPKAGRRGLACRTEKRIRMSSRSHGMGRHSQNEVEKMARRDVQALSVLLGKKKYFLGDKPHEVDCALFGMLGQLVWNFPNSYFETMVNGEFDNLKAFCFRMKEEFWPDWDNCLAQK